ncbi:hypothetical protein [Paragemmobacter ruber]|uniref:Translocase n=1 Tax=Paragemmobacter ruber TaxID=1985673 RepID=A0ABW9Y4U8_9RHOB|nr:hypothetical protein [Rhodobacter ruber]NBE07422.1 hypothetical protein [Rhodobacter ruber]
MDRKRSFIMAGGTVLLALGAGQYMQSGTAQSSAAMVPVPQVAPPPPLRQAAGTPLGAHDPMPPMAAPQVTPVALPTAASADAPAPEAGAALPRPTPMADTCPIALDAFATADAVLSISLAAPCQPNQTVVLAHAGLAVTYQTTATGALFADIPALDPAGVLSIRFPDGQLAEVAAPVPEVASLRRLAVQWMEGDTFNLTGAGPVTTLGTLSGPVPMQARLIDLPDTTAPLAIEAEVTARTCGRELLGEVLFSEGGRVTRADLTLAMPECDGAGGFVALNNPLPDMKLAAAR